MPPPPKAAHESKFILGAVTTRLTVTVPYGLSGGELVRVAAPNSVYHTVIIPDGLTSGQQARPLSCSLPTGSPRPPELLSPPSPPDAHSRARRSQFSVELFAHGGAGDQQGTNIELAKLRVELEAEKHLRRETQQEALRSRSALEALHQKRRADHAFLRDMVKRQRRCIEQLTQQFQEDLSSPGFSHFNHGL